MPNTFTTYNPTTGVTRTQDSNTGAVISQTGGNPSPSTSGGGTNVGYYQDIGTGLVYTKPETSEGGFTQVTNPIVVVGGGHTNVNTSAGATNTSGLPPIQTPQVTVSPNYNTPLTQNYNNSISPTIATSNLPPSLQPAVTSRSLEQTPTPNQQMTIGQLGLSPQEIDYVRQEAMREHRQVTEQDFMDYAQLKIEHNVPTYNNEVHSLASGDKIIYDAKGNAIGVESNLFHQTLSIQDYNNKIAELPSSKFSNSTQQLFDDNQEVMIGEYPSTTTTPYKLYTNPKTGEPIQDLSTYLAENKLKIFNVPPNTSELPSLHLTPIKEASTYDLTNLPFQYRTGGVGQEKFIENGVSSAEPLAEAILTLGAGIGKMALTEGVGVGIRALLSEAGINELKMGALTLGTKVVGLVGERPDIALLNVMYPQEIVSGQEQIINAVLPNNDIPSQIAMGLIYSETAPISGIAYGEEIGKALYENPSATVSSALMSIGRSPFMFATMVAPYQYLSESMPIELRYNQLHLTPEQLDMMGEISPQKPLKLQYYSPEKAEMDLLVQKFKEKGQKVVITEGSQVAFIPRYKDILSNIAGIEVTASESYLGKPMGGAVSFKNTEGVEFTFKQTREQAVLSRYEKISELTHGEDAVSRTFAEEQVRYHAPKEIQYELINTRATVVQPIGEEVRVEITGIQKETPIKVKTKGFSENAKYYAEATSSGMKQEHNFVETLAREPVQVDKKFTKLKDLDINEKSFYEGTREVTGGRLKNPQYLSMKYLIERNKLLRYNPEESSFFIQKEEVTQVSSSQKLNENLKPLAEMSIEQSKSLIKTAQPFEVVEVIKEFRRSNEFDIKTNKFFKQETFNAEGKRLTGTQETFMLNPEKIMEANPIPTSAGFKDTYNLVASKEVNFNEELPSPKAVETVKGRAPKVIYYTDESGVIRKLNTSNSDFSPKEKIVIRRFRTLNIDEPQVSKMNGTIATIGGKRIPVEEYSKYQQSPYYKNYMRNLQTKAYYRGSSVFGEETLSQFANIQLPSASLVSFSKSVSRTFKKIAPDFFSTGIQMADAEELSIESISQPSESAITKTEMKLDLNLIPQTEPRLQPEIKVETEVKTEARLEPRLEPKLEPRLEPKLEPRLEPKLEPRLEPKLEPRLEPQIKIRFREESGKGFGYGFADEKKKKKGGKGYQTKVRVKGKFVSVGISEDITKADLLGKRTTLKNLSASYEIENLSTGKLVKPISSPYFRPSKRNPMINVQKEFTVNGSGFTGRLSSKSERAQIVSSRRNKKRGMID